MSLLAGNVSRSIGDKHQLRGISCEFFPGTLTAVVGPNGAGKTTLLRVLSGELSPDSGEVSYDGRPVQRIALRERARMRSVMTQSSHIPFDFTVEDVLMMGWVRQPEEFDPLALEAIIQRCQIEHLAARTFNTLSGGEQQRVQFVRALLQLGSIESPKDTQYLLLDEPTSNLDVLHELTLMELAKQTATRGAAVVAVLHDLNLASRFADQILLLRQGAVEAFGPPAQVLTSPILSDVYATPMHVEHHDNLQRLVVFS